MLCPRLILMISLLLVAACRRENTNPELIDPIYRFLQTEVSTLKGAAEEEKKKIGEAESAYKKTDALTHERKLAVKDLEAAKRSLSKILQDQVYMTIRLERRRVEGRRDYKAAFKAEKSWPDPSEYQQFLTQHRLRTASRQWEGRVPRLHDRILAAWPRLDTKAKKEPVAGAE